MPLTRVFYHLEVLKILEILNNIEHIDVDVRENIFEYIYDFIIFNFIRGLHVMLSALRELVDM